MPELPEVEYGRKLAESICQKQLIKNVHCAEDAIVFEKRTATEISEALLGTRVQHVRRRGKFIWFELNKKPWPIFHFGMTGSFQTPNQKTIQLESGPKKQANQWPPRFTKIHFTMESGAELVMTNSRRLGRIRLSADPLADQSIAKLGFDPLTDMPAFGEFQQSLQKRKGNLKGLLLNQSFAAGVGNWIADEVLFQAGIAPTRRVTELGPEQIRSLYNSLEYVIHTAVELDADKAQFPASWLFHHRWGKNKLAQTSDGAPIRFEQISGRTTAWVPNRQH